ncbi:type II secretion system F family protein [Gilvimarinus agarilyticus]|uniref:type II secretion system F family protein n=1 Tax=Gilvimarinus sp. 2_MG-2023 TaxID=3062666 RepID=UPI001C08B739|nr:type II secretion system F family protein [Gilvimarinus sp. 2_MG-2023]MBU2885280.1 type II secretion system F family protein [Gilvimarinus agarilyticus]MDO6570177.1 type II secretion system F family protein [Gilvimarinus sp. 2_MG-2023]
MIGGLTDIGTLAAVVVLVFVTAMCLAMAVTREAGDFMSFYRRKFTSNANQELAEMFIFMDTSQLFMINMAALVLIPMGVHWLFQLWVITAGVFVVLLIVPGGIWARMRKKRLAKFEEQLPDIFMMLASSLQAGASMNMALSDMVKQAPAPANQEFGLLVKRMQLGVTLEDSLIELEKRLPLQSFIMASSAIRISREVGGNLVETIQSMAETLRRKKTMEGKIDSLTAQGRAQGTFMAMLPIALAVLLSFLEPEAMRKLYTTREGLMVLAVMVFMQIMGFTFIRKITSIDS